jgi:parallel beta helix pectate lyase-like protein
MSAKLFGFGPNFIHFLLIAIFAMLLCAMSSAEGCGCAESGTNTETGVGSDDPETMQCETSLSHAPGHYDFRIRVTLTSNCDTVTYQRTRYDDSGDPETISAESPVRGVLIDRDTDLVFYSEQVSDSEIENVDENERTAIYSFPPRFDGILLGHSGYEEIVLQWEPAWDAHGPITYRVYQPLPGEPVLTLDPLIETNDTEMTIDDSVLDIENGQTECFVVRSVDSTGAEDLNYVEKCLTPHDVLYVNAAAVAAGDGSKELPFQTIQEANEALPEGRYFTSIWVAGGAYNEQVDFSNNDPPDTTHIRAAQIYGGFNSADWSRDLYNQPTVVDGGGGVVWKPGEWDLVDGFVITGGETGFLLGNQLNVTISNCYVAGNNGYGIEVRGEEAVVGPSLTSSVVTENGGGILLYGATDPEADVGVKALLRNLIIHGNDGAGVDGQGIGTGGNNVGIHVRVRNSVIWRNQTGASLTRTGTSVTANMELSNVVVGENDTDLVCQGCLDEAMSIEYSDVLEPDGFDGEENVSVDPMFVDPTDDFHLDENSPLVDAGSPDPLFDDPDTTQNDIGAFGGVGAIWRPLVWQ